MTAFLDTLEQEDAKSWRVNVEVKKQKVCFKLDTGAEVTAINDQTHQKLKQNAKLSKVNKALYGPSRHQLTVLGQLNAYLSHKNKCCVVEQPMYVVKGLQSNLLGLAAIKSLDLVANIDTTESIPSTASQIWEKFPSIFTGLGNLGEEYEVQLKPIHTKICALAVTQETS